MDEALADFSGDLAIDEVYDGPCGILSVVDHRRYHRLAYHVLEHDPTQDDVRAFLTEFKAQLDRRGLTVQGITTDGSVPIRYLRERIPSGTVSSACDSDRNGT